MFPASYKSLSADDKPLVDSMVEFALSLEWDEALGTVKHNASERPVRMCTFCSFVDNNLIRMKRHMSAYHQKQFQREKTVGKRGKEMTRSAWQNFFFLNTR